MLNLQFEKQTASLSAGKFNRRIEVRFLENFSVPMIKIIKPQLISQSQKRR